MAYIIKQKEIPTTFGTVRRLEPYILTDYAVYFGRT